MHGQPVAYDTMSTKIRRRGGIAYGRDIVKELEIVFGVFIWVQEGSTIREGKAMRN